MNNGGKLSSEWKEDSLEKTWSCCVWITESRGIVQQQKAFWPESQIKRR